MSNRCIDRFATAGERRRASRLVSALLAAGYRLSVNDGEEWTVKQSRNKGEVMAALATTGEDYLKAHQEEVTKTKEGRHVRKVVASFCLIWGNARDGSELIADHSDNEIARQFA